jgi:hypothetical protein
MSQLTRRRKFRMRFSSKAFFQKNKAREAELALGRGWGIIGCEPYYPYIPVHRYAGSGFAVRPLCPLTGELIHCHSLGEGHFALQLLWAEDHVRLFSQVAIPRNDSVPIAKFLKIVHPRFSCGTPSVRTLDFVHLCTGGRWFAYSFKNSRESVKPRDRDLIEIERKYCEDNNITWSMAYKTDLDRDLIQNIQWVEAFVGVSPMIYGSNRWKELEPEFFAQVRSGNPLNQASCAAQRKLRMPKNTGLTLVKFFIANRIWKINWKKRINPFEPLAILGRNTNSLT